MPSIASRPATVSVVPSTASRRQIVTPSRFGRSLPRWAKMPTFGQSVRPRGWRAPATTALSATRSKRKTTSTCEKPSSPASAWGRIRRQRDRRRHRVPAVVDRLGAPAAHIADRAERKVLGGGPGFVGHRRLLCVRRAPIGSGGRAINAGVRRRGGPASSQCRKPAPFRVLAGHAMSASGESHAAVMAGFVPAIHAVAPPPCSQASLRL